MPRPRSLPFFFDAAARLEKPVPVRELEALVHHMREVAAVVGGVGAGLVRHLRRADEIAPPDLDRIDADDGRRAIEQPLDQSKSLPAVLRRDRDAPGRCW